MLLSPNPLSAKAKKDIPFARILLELTMHLRNPRIFLCYYSRTPIVLFRRLRHFRSHFPCLLRLTCQLILLISRSILPASATLPLLLCLSVLQDHTTLMTVSISFLSLTKMTVLVLHHKLFLLQKPTTTGSHIPTPSSMILAICLRYLACITFDRIFRITSCICN